MQDLEYLARLQEPVGRPQSSYDRDLRLLSPGSPDAETSSWRASLGRLIEAEIIPRLMLSQHMRAAGDLPPSASIANDLDEIAAFVRVLLKMDLDGALAEVRARRRRGASIEAVLLNFLAPAARRLGELWESDQCDFLEVTIGLRRLEQIVQVLGPELQVVGFPPRGAHRILLLATPGESHMFGLSIVEHLFRAAGWNVERSTDGDWRSVLSTSDFDVIGFSISCIRYVGELKRAIATARNITRNPSLLVLVGGSLCLDNPKIIETVGADATATDAASADRLARSLLSRQPAV